ncbi:hypothetical protein SPI_02861 [Niveomyces insectorum RCEF 264]|uniref:Uncharacterized protein n=1 Tax=Niveomyces insectorum RCEF 264 TaxID=1081102 RepID=A0A167WV24_9HYPO|nr:hypothetical protein SPI_02861 [Niveomyces insectorum RCEF 264]
MATSQTTFKTLSVTEAISKLCAEQRDREVLRETGPLREYKPHEGDRDIVAGFHEEHGSKISDEARLAGRVVSKPRFYGPRQLGFGILESQNQTITVYIPMASNLPQPTGNLKVLYQPDYDYNSAEEQESNGQEPARVD